MPSSAILPLMCNILFLISGVGVFMFGMRVMSDGLESSAGKSLQKMFAKISNNRFAGVGIGAASTAIVQSSGATSVMVIGFVNAGIMTLAQALPILMGANIGTTITAFLVALKGVADIVPFLFMALAPIGVFMSMFAKRDKTKRIGGIMTGVGLIFIGLEVMSVALRDEYIKQGLAAVFTNEFFSFPLLLIVIGVVATALLQSSSVVTAILIALLAQPGSGMTLESAIFIVLGSNIGTCAVALFASSGASNAAKRAALFMLLFNVFGVALFTPLIWPLQHEITAALLAAMGGSVTFAMALFHFCFNTVTMLLLIGFNPKLVRTLNRLIKDQPMSDVPDKLYFLDKRLLRTPQIAVAQTTKEVINMAHIAERNFDMSIENLLDETADHGEEIARRERELNYLNKAITNYLVKISELNITSSDEKLLGSYYHVVSDLERIGDHAENFDDIAEQMRKEGIRFSETAKTEIMDMYTKIKLLFKDSMYTFETRSDEIFDVINKTEQAVDELQKLYEQHHVERLKTGACSVESGVFFNRCTTDLERVADHLTNIAYSVKPKRV